MTSRVLLSHTTVVEGTRFGATLPQLKNYPVSVYSNPNGPMNITQVSSDTPHPKGLLVGSWRIPVQVSSIPSDFRCGEAQSLYMRSLTQQYSTGHRSTLLLHSMHQ